MLSRFTLEAKFMLGVLATCLLATTPAFAVVFNASAGHFWDPVNNAVYIRQPGQATYDVPVDINHQEVYITQGGAFQNYTVEWEMGFSVWRFPYNLRQGARHRNNN